MKNTILLTAVLIATLTVSAQTIALDKYFSAYKADESFTKIEITGKMMQLASHIEGKTDEEKQMLEAIQKIDGIQVVAKEATDKAAQLYKEATAKVKSGMDELMSINDKDADVKLYIRETGGIISELLVIAAGDSEFAIVDVYGEIDLATVREITDAISLRGMDKVSDELLENASSVSVYPNPAATGQNVTLKHSGKLAGGLLKIFDASGKMVFTQTLSGTQSVIPSSTFSSGNYLVTIEKDNARIYGESLVVQ